jgi:predicted AAA+ superfamily ATPase
LENIVAIELFRNEQEFYYFSDKKECDFVVKNKFWLEVINAIQVTWELDFHNREREIGGLIKALESCKLSEGYILTYNQTEEVEENWYTIHVLPVWKWLLKW